MNYPQPVWIDYTNWRGERRWREIAPLDIAWENCPIDYDNQTERSYRWVLHAVDTERDVRRSFYLTHIHAFSDSKP